MQLLKNEIINLRAPEPKDINLLYEWENNSELWQVSNTLAPFSKYLLAKYIKNAKLDIYQTKELRLIIENITNSGNKAVGIIDLFDFDPFHSRAGVGIMIYNKADRKQHFATESLKLLINYCFGYLKLNQLFCNISEENEISLQLFKNVGFKINGQKEKWIKTNSGYKTEFFLQLINPATFNQFLS